MGAPNEENNGSLSSRPEGKQKGINFKTVFLIRHAESDENRRRASLTKCFEQITAFPPAIPSTEDLEASFELLNVPAQLNSDVSNVGAQQIKHMGEVLRESKFLEENKVQLVVHSPLLRARQTCQGLLGCVASPLQKPSSVSRVEELDFLVERQPNEIPEEFILKDVAPKSSSFTRRIMQFEQWLAKQPEDIVAVVGHSLHFKTVLNVPFKFGNCEVWECKFDPSQRIQSETTTKPPTNSLLPDLQIPRAMQQMNVFQNNRETTVSPWSGLKRVHGCEIKRENNSLGNQQASQVIS